VEMGNLMMTLDDNLPGADDEEEDDE